MNALEELREMVKIQRHEQPPSYFLSLTEAAWNSALDEALAAIDQFEADHPGLVDRTVECGVCGARGGPPKPDETVPRLLHFVGEEAGGLWIEDPDLYCDLFDCLLCPDCAEEAE